MVGLPPSTLYFIAAPPVALLREILAPRGRTVASESSVFGVATGAAFRRLGAKGEKEFTGAGVSYDITDNVSLGLNYDGLFGKNTSAHMGTASITFSF